MTTVPDDTVSLEKDGAPGPAAPPPVTTPPPPPAALRRRSRSAVARSSAGDRWLLVLLGLILLVAGTLVALLSAGVFGTGRADRPLLDPLIVEAMRAQPLAARIIALLVGVALLVLGLVWTARSLRPERHPDLVLDTGADTAIVVSGPAAADAVAEQAQTLPGVGRARARMVGSEQSPALRVTLWLADEADVRDVLRRLDETVLADARAALGLSALPAAIRLELDQVTSGPRVA